MKARFPLLLTVLIAVGMAAPGAVAKDKGKAKDKKKDKVERSDRDADRRDDHDDDDHDGNGRITICHIPPGNAGARHTITVSESAWDAHRKHGDRRGACDRPGDGDGRKDAFDRLDRDNDGRLILAEWPYGHDSFRRLDRNGDGVLGRDEFARRDSEPDRRRFEDLDRNRDGRLSRAEWPFGREAFDRTDRNRDDLISREEYGRY
jgi:EF hand domain-containing protein